MSSDLVAIEVLTGPTGNIGMHFPREFKPLKSRLQGSVSEMENELSALGQPISSFVHLAGLTTPVECDEKPELAHEVNVQGALRWFEAAAKQGAKVFLFTSTSHVYGNPRRHERLSVESPLNPVSLYARLKVEAERSLLELATRFPQTKLRIARLFTVLSPAMKPGFLYTNLHRRAKERDFSPIRGLSYYRDFLTMDEAVRQLVALARIDQAPPIVNICSGRPQTVRDLARQVFAQYGLDADQIEEGPGQPGDIEWLVGEPNF